jgi:adenylate cyclase
MTTQRHGQSTLFSYLRGFLSDRRLLLRIQVGVASGLTIGLLTSAATLSDLFTPLQVFLSDWVYTSHPSSTQIIIVAIDDKSIADVGPWPWGRAPQLALVERLREAPPRVLAFGIPFTQSADDEEFAAIWPEETTVILPTAFNKSVAPTIRPGAFPSYDNIQRPPAPLLSKSLVAHKVLAPDADGTVRRVPAAIESNGIRYYDLGLIAAASFLHESIDADVGKGKLTLGTRSVGIDSAGRSLINFSGPPQTVTTYSFTDVIAGRISSDNFRDKLVFVGIIGEAEPELYATPLTKKGMVDSNIDIQAQVADMWVSTPPHLLEPLDGLALIAMVLVASLAAGITLPLLQPLSAAAFTFIYALAYILLSFELFARGILPNLLFPPSALVLTFLTILGYRNMTEERRRTGLISIFRRFLPKETVKRVIENVDKGQIKLEGMEKYVTILHIDIRGLSDITNHTDAETFLSTVEKRLEVVTEAIRQEGGSVTKSLGISVFAVWNGLLQQPDHIVQALNASIEIRHLIRSEWDEVSGISLSIGMGISTGNAILGNIKTADHSEFTIIGRPVDLAQQLSGFSAPGQILVDRVTAANVPREIELRELSPIRLRGHKDPLPIWEVVKSGEVVEIEEENAE